MIMTALAILIAVSEYLYISTSSTVYVEMLNEADALMEQNEAARAREIAERADCRFSNQAGIYDIFMFHSDVTDIGNSLASLRRYAQTGDASEFLAASARIKRTFISLSKALSPKLENIF